MAHLFLYREMIKKEKFVELMKHFYKKKNDEAKVHLFNKFNKAILTHDSIAQRIDQIDRRK